MIRAETQTEPVIDQDITDLVRAVAYLRAKPERLAWARESPDNARLLIGNFALGSRATAALEVFLGLRKVRTTSFWF